MINYTSFTQQQLIKLAKQKTREVFSPEEQHLRSYTFENPPHKRKYIHFSALHYFESAIITPDMITSLQNNATLLSVGSGEGHLERLLKDGFHIPTKNITTSDLYEDPNIGNPTNQSRTHRFFNELDKTEKEILAGNLNPQHLNFFMQVVGMDVSRVH